MRREAAERLRNVQEEQLQALAVLAEFRRGAKGALRQVAPSAPFAREEGVRMRDGVLQLGLEPEEIDGLRARLRRLIAAVDGGEIPLRPRERSPGRTSH